MKRHTTTIALAAILIPTVCFAWGRNGHGITGFIAAKYLTPKVDHVSVSQARCTGWRRQCDAEPGMGSTKLQDVECISN